MARDARKSSSAGSSAPTHDARAAFARNFLGQCAGLVQADDRRLPGAQSAGDVSRRRARAGHRRLAAAARVHLHAGDGAQVLSAAARRPAGDRSRADRADDAGIGLRGDGAGRAGHPAAGVHGRRHLFPERAAAVHVHQDPAGHPLAARARCDHLPDGRGAVGISRCADRGRRGDHGRAPASTRSSIASRPASITTPSTIVGHDDRRAGAASLRSRCISRLSCAA